MTDNPILWVLLAIGAILLFVANLVLGKDVNGSRNWIFIGPFSFQPSEFIKIAFVFVGASTLDHLQTKKNITEFIVFAAICLAFLFLMRDFGTALIFFACFLIIAFMRSGSFRTIFLILAACSLFCSLNPTLPSASRAGCTCGSTHRTASATSRCAP